jgi:hypothetical protein
MGASIIVLGQRRALAELDTTIGQIEQARHEQLTAATRLAAAGADAAPVRTLLRLTDDYLACLRQSRAVLRWELPQEGDHGAGAMLATAVHRPIGATAVRPRLIE